MGRAPRGCTRANPESWEGCPQGSKFKDSRRLDWAGARIKDPLNLIKDDCWELDALIRSRQDISGNSGQNRSTGSREV